MSTILVTGATGTIGRRLVHTLTDQGHRPTVLLRDPTRAAALGPDLERVTRVIGDYVDTAAVQAALRGVDRVFLLSPNGPDQVRHERTLIDAAAHAGVSRVVKVSAHGAHPDSPVAFWRGHAAIEDHLLHTGMPSVALRPRFSMANILGHADGVRAHGVVFAPAVHAPVAMVDPQDVADLAAHLLTTDDPPTAPHLDVSGPTGVTFTDLAEMIGTLAGRTVTYHPGTDEETATYLAQHGTPPFVTRQILAIFTALRAGAQAQPATTVTEILGREPRTLTAFLSGHADTFRAAS